MIQEAMEWLDKQATRMASKATLSSDPPDFFRLFKADGSVDLMQSPSPVRTMVVLDLESIVELAVAPFDLTMLRRPAIFVAPEQVTLVFDTIRGLERATFPLQTTEEYDWIRARLGSSSGLSVETFRDDLRYVLFEAAPAGLVEIISSIEITQRNQNTEQRGRATESLGSHIVTSAIPPAADDFPDSVQTFQLRLWRQKALKGRMPVRVFVDPDLSIRGWKIVPVLQDIDDFVAENVQILAGTLSEMIRKHTGDSGGDAVKDGIPIIVGSYRIHTEGPAPLD